MLIVKCISSVQFSCSVMSDSLGHHGLQHTKPPLSITNSRSLLKLLPIESVMPSNNLTLYRPLFLLPAIFPIIRVFSKESALCIKWSKYWSFSFSISPSKEMHRSIECKTQQHILCLVTPCELPGTPPEVNTIKSAPQHNQTATFLWTKNKELF